MPTRLSTPANRSLETADAEPLVLLRRPIRSGSLLRRGVTTSAVGDSDGFKASKLLLRRQIGKGSSLRRGASSPFNPSAVLFQSSIDSSSRSISIEILSKVLANPQFAVFNRTPWSRSVKRLSAELINPLFDSVSIQSLSKVLISSLFTIFTRSRSAKSSSAELVVVISLSQRRTRKKKQLLTLIRDFASEKSQGERRVSDLKNRVGELRPEIEIATANIEEAMKRKNGPTAAIKCLHDSDSFVDVNFVGDVCLKVRKAEVVVREESPNEVRAGYEEFKADVHALFLAVRNSNVALVRKLLSIGADVNQKLFRGYATTVAVRENHLEILEMLLKAGASQQACEEALLEASCYGHARIAELLMGSDLIRPRIAVHALFTACCRGFANVVDALLKCGVDVNAISRVLLQSCKPSLHTNGYYKVEGAKYIFEPKTIRRMIQTERIFLFKTMTVSDLYAQNRVFVYRLIRLSALELVWKAVGTDLIKMMNPIAVNRYKRFPKAGLAAQIATGPLSAPVNMFAFEKKNNETILVFDLGGGTFDVSVLEVGDGVFEVLSTPRDIHLGDDVNVSVTTMTNNLSSPTSMLSFAAKVRKGNERVAKLFENDLEKVGADIDSDVNSRSYCGQTALMQACRFGHWKVVQILGGDDFDKRIGDWLASNFKEDEGIDLLELLLKLNGQQELLEFQSH